MSEQRGATLKIQEEDTVNGNEISLSIGKFIISYNQQNKVIWAKNTPTLYNIHSLTLTKDDEILISANANNSSKTINVPAEETINGIGIEKTWTDGNGASILIKYDVDGKIEYLQCLNNYMSYTSVVSTEEGTIFIGRNVWGKNFTIPADDTEKNEEVEVTINGYHILVFKYSTNGKFEWYKTITAHEYQGTVSGEATNDGGLIVTGVNNIYKLDSNAEIQWQFSVKGIVDTCETEMGNYVAVGTIKSNNINTAVTAKYKEEILAAEVPSNQKVSAKNEKIKYTIKGMVEGEGGTITIGANKTIETVKYNENSIEDIVITPETGYQIKSIKINEQNYEFEPKEDGTVTLAKFENVVQNKNIVVTFLKTSLASDVVVHHYLWENGSVTTTPVILDELITGETGEQYTALPKLNLAKYELITNSDYYGENIPEGILEEDYYIPENSVGTITEGIEVTYYYKLKTYTITIHHYLDGTKTSLVPDTTKTELEIYTSYRTNIEKTSDLKYQLTTNINGTEEAEVMEIDAQRYKILSIEGNEEGTITENIEITYYYTDTAFNLTVEKVWEDNENTANTRPKQITIQLLKNGAEFQEYVLDVANGENSYTFTELYKYDENEKEITYTAQELSVPNGYYVSSTTKQNNKIIITNSKLGSITINKIDKKTSELLQGAEFKIEKQQGENWLEIQTITTDENGQAKIEKLQYGIYKITETKAPEGYNLNKKSQEIEISSSNIDSEITITNREKTILPEAGGDGAYLIIAIGIITIIGGIIIKNNNRKQKSKH